MYIKMYLSDFRIFVSGPTCPPRAGAVHWLGGRAFSSVNGRQRQLTGLLPVVSKNQINKART